MIFVSDRAENAEKIYQSTDFYALPELKKLNNEFEITSAGDGNIITLDRCRYRIDGGDWIYDDVCVIQHRLFACQCDCDLEMEFDFEIGEKFDLSTPLTLISETPAMFEYFLNGIKFEAVDGGKFFDQAFRRIALPQNLKSGTNTIGMKCRFHQDQSVYDALEKARKRLIFDEFFLFSLAMRQLKGQRSTEKNHFVLKEKEPVTELIKTLPYQLTEAQNRVLGGDT